MTLRKITAESSANVTECGPTVTPHFRGPNQPYKRSALL